MKNPKRNSNKITSIAELFDELGGPKKIAEFVDLAGPTVRTWKRRSTVPPKFWRDLQKMALDKEIILTAEDFFRIHGMDVLTEFR